MFQIHIEVQSEKIGEILELRQDFGAGRRLALTRLRSSSLDALISGSRFLCNFKSVTASTKRIVVPSVANGATLPRSIDQDLLDIRING